MNELYRNLIMIASGLVGGVIFVYIKNKIFKKAEQTIVKLIPEEDKAKVKELYEKGLVPKQVYDKVCSAPATTECFNSTKLITGLTKVNSATLWAKDLSSIFNLRKLIIVGVIIGVIFGFGWYRGRMGKDVIFDMRGKEAVIQLNEHYLKIEKDGTANVVDKDGKVLKRITVKDVDGLREALRPYGFRLKPFVTAGGSVGSGGVSGAKFEGGGGLDFFKWFKWNANVFLTNVGAYLGVGYNVTDNFDVLLGLGKGYKEFDTRVYLGGKFKF